MGRIVDEIIDMHCNGYSNEEIAKTIGDSVENFAWIIENFDKEEAKGC